MTGNSRINLREKRTSDAREDYAWQTDHELTDLDATSVLTCSYSEYVTDYAAALRYTANHRVAFAVETPDGRHIANLTCYDIDTNKGEAQLGIIIGDRDYWGKGYGVEAMNALVDYVFNNSKLQRVYLKTLDWNVRARKCFLKCGFTPCGYVNEDGFNFLAMELYRNEWEKRKAPQAPPTGGEPP